MPIFFPVATAGREVRMGRFPKKWDGHEAMSGQFHAWYNQTCPHSKFKTTPAVAAGIGSESWALARPLSELAQASSSETARTDSMHDEVVPILHVKDGYETAKWYERLEFRVESEHRFAPGMPLYLFLVRGHLHLHLSEHQGDAKPGTLLYFYVDKVDPIAKEFGAEVIEQPWCREVKLTDPDGNRWRIGERR